MKREDKGGRNEKVRRAEKSSIIHRKGPRVRNERMR